MDEQFEAFENEMNNVATAQQVVLAMNAMDAYDSLIAYIIELEQRIGIRQDDEVINAPEDFLERRNMAMDSFSFLGELVTLGVAVYNPS